MENKTILTKEQLELIISEKYNEAKDFIWENDTVSFYNTGSITTDYIEQLKYTVTSLKEVLTYRDGQLSEARRALNLFVVEDKEEGGESV